MKTHSYQDIIDIYFISHDTIEIMMCGETLPRVSTEIHETLSFTHYRTVDDTYFFRSSSVVSENEITLVVDSIPFHIKKKRFTNKTLCHGIDLTTTTTDSVEIRPYSNQSYVVYVRGEQHNDDHDSLVYVTWPHTVENKYIGHHFLYRFGKNSKCVVWTTRVHSLELHHVKHLEDSNEPYHTYNGVFYVHSSAVKSLSPSITDTNGDIVPIHMFRPIEESPQQKQLSKTRRDTIIFVLVMTVTVILCVLCITVVCIQIKR